MKIDPNAPAYPFAADHSSTAKYLCDIGYGGLPIRLELAARVIQGFASNPERTKYTVDEDAEVALEAADALIAAYNATEDK